MTPVSKKVVVLGFRSHHTTATAVSNALSGIAEVSFGDSNLQPGQLGIVDGIVIGRDFDFDSEDNFDLVNNAVQRGANLVVLGLTNSPTSLNWYNLLGAKPSVSQRATEWFFSTQSPDLPLTQRIAPEFAAVGELTPLQPTETADSFLTTSIGFRDYVTGVIKSYRYSFVVTLGIYPTTPALSRDLATIISRAATFHPDDLDQRKSTLGVGIIGFGPYGGMGHYHGTAASEVQGLNLVAVVDRDANRRKAAEAEFPNVRTYPTVEELANDGEIDICVVATPPVSHAEISMKMLEADKHVICEKPMCLTYKEAQDLIATARSRNRMLTINQNRRWDRDFRAISRAVSQGKLGEVFNIETFVGGYEHPCRAWHSEESISGGAIYDWGSHHIDWISQLYGDTPSHVSAIGHKRVWRDVTNVDQIRVHMLWDDGREAEFFQSDIAAIRKPKFFIQGTAGTLVGHYRPIVGEEVGFPFGYVEHEYHHAEAPSVLKLARYESEYGLVEESLPPERPQQFAFHRNVADHLLMGEPLAVKPESVAEVIKVLESAHHSATSGSQYISLKDN